MRHFLPFCALAILSCNALAQGLPRVEPIGESIRKPESSGPYISSEDLARLQAHPKPAEQKDLSTYELASAHRERASSMEERTNGLWQSWLVSICEGCEPERKPFSDFSGENYLKTLRDRKAQIVSGRSKYTYYYLTPRQQKIKYKTIAVDLSNERIDQIRRDPNR